MRKKKRPKQRRTKRCAQQLIEGLTVDEFIRRNADPIWLHQHGMWEYIECEDTTSVSDEWHAIVQEFESGWDGPWEWLEHADDLSKSYWRVGKYWLTEQPLPGEQKWLDSSKWKMKKPPKRGRKGRR